MELDAKQKLEMEIEEMKGKLEVMKHLGNQDDEAVQAKMKEMNESLADKIESLEDLEELNSTLLTKERETNDELQEARKALIEVKRVLVFLSHSCFSRQRMNNFFFLPVLGSGRFTGWSSGLRDKKNGRDRFEAVLYDLQAAILSRGSRYSCHHFVFFVAGKAERHELASLQDGANR